MLIANNSVALTAKKPEIVEINKIKMPSLAI